MKKKARYFLLGLIICSLSVLGYGYVNKWLERPYLTVIGGIFSPDGLGRQAIDLIDLMKDECLISCIPLYKIDRFKQDIPPAVRKILKKKYQRLGNVVVCEEPFSFSKEVLHKTMPLRQQSRPDQIWYAYSMFDSNRIPTEWVDILNRYYDAVIVPDPFLVDVYKESGIRIPIFELGLQRDFTDFLNTPLKVKRHSPFTFGCLGSGLERKNHLMLIKAFEKAFGSRRDVRLLINCRTLDPKPKLQIEELLSKTEARVEFTQYCLDNKAYLELLQCIDCLVCLSKGEGFSIQPREAMALGIPAIITDNTAQHTICRSDLVKSIPCPYAEPAHYDWYPKSPLGNFYQCEEDEVVDALLDMERNYDHYLQKNQAAREWAAQYDAARLKPFYLSLIKPKKVIFGKENKITTEYIITDSETLYKKWRTLFKKNPTPGKIL